MTVMIAEVYDALKSAGADDGPARRAAEALAEWKGESQGIRAEISELRGEMRSGFSELRSDLRSEIGGLKTELRTEIADSRAERRVDLEKVRSELAIRKWMFGAVVVLNTGIFIRLLFT